MYADQLETPEEIIQYRPRKSGGLGMIHVKYKATAELIRSFIETALDQRFKQNLFHFSIYQWNILYNRDIPDPGRYPYLTEEIFALIREVKEEGLLNISTMKSGMWYRVLVENRVTMMRRADGTRTLKACRAESKHPDVDWPTVWRLANQKGLNPTEKTFLFRLLHDLLPTQERLFRLGIRNTNSPNCLLCIQDVSANLTHTLITCPHNSDVSSWLTTMLRVHVPQLQPQQVVLLDLGDLEESVQLPLVWLISNTLHNIWKDRTEKKKPNLHRTRSSLEAKINILRKTRFQNAVQIIENLLKTS